VLIEAIRSGLSSVMFPQMSGMRRP